MNRFSRSSQGYRQLPQQIALCLWRWANKHVRNHSGSGFLTSDLGMRSGDLLDLHQRRKRGNKVFSKSRVSRSFALPTAQTSGQP